ncbi:MAG: histidine kinase, partial [[Ruminococcus] gnavus]|nr:histidine kinase [Mediterraneibacter gnavus]
MQKINEWWRTKFKNITLTRKMLLVYAVFAGFFFGVSILAFQGSTDVFEKKLYDNSIRELDYYAKDVKDSLQRVSDRSYEMLLDSELQSILGKLQQTKPETLEYNQLLTSIRWSLVNDKNLKSDIQTIYYIDNYGNTVESGQAAWEIPEEEKDVFMQKIRDSNGEAVFYGPTKKCKYLLCGRKMLNWQDMSLENMGTLMLVCDVGQMIERDKKLLEAEHASMFVYTDDHMIYQDIEESLPPLPQNKDGQGHKVLNYQGERYFMCYLSTSENGWMYVNFFPYSDVYGQIERVRNLALCSFCVVFVLLLFLIHRISEIITRPLETLVRSMQVVETGDFESAKQIPMDAEREDEVGLLTKEFRVMLDQIDVLVKENYEKQFLLKDTKYKMLQAQINPHFLYNTLNVIHWMIRAKENEKASRMIVELGALLRASFNENPYITVEEEIGM